MSAVKQTSPDLIFTLTLVPYGFQAEFTVNGITYGTICADFAESRGERDVALLAARLLAENFLPLLKDAVLTLVCSTCSGDKKIMKSNGKKWVAIDCPTCCP